VSDEVQFFMLDFVFYVRIIREMTYIITTINKLGGERTVPDKKNRPNPDDRSDNVEKLQEMIHDTYENIAEAEDHLQWASGEDRENIKEKNKRRREAIEGFRDEIKDENKR